MNNSVLQMNNTVPSSTVQDSSMNQNNVSSISTQSKTNSRGVKRKKYDAIIKEITKMTISIKEIIQAITNSIRRIYTTIKITT